MNELTEKTHEERNKKAALEYYQLLIGDIDYDAAEKYTAGYIQHDPMVDGDGFEPLKRFLTTHPWFKDRPKTKVECSNVMADGDLVYFQLHKEVPGGEDEKGLVQHLFRFNDEGKIAEHWTTVTKIKLSETKNPHPLW